MKRIEATDLMWDMTRAVTGVGSQTQTEEQRKVSHLLDKVEIYVSPVSALSILSELVLAAFDAGRQSAKGIK